MDNNRARRLIQLARAMSPVEDEPMDNAMENVDQGYETSPAPSLDVSLDFGSDDSVKDPPYAPSNHSSDIITDSECSAPPSPSSNTNPVCSLPEGTTQENEMDLENNILQESPNIVILSNIRLENKSQLVSSVQSINKRRKKKTFCKYCESEVTNFERHLERNHTDSKEVKDMLSYPKKSSERRKIIGLIRNAGHFKEYLRGTIRPKYGSNSKTKVYYPCYKCKALLVKDYLSRHKEYCMLKNVNATSDKVRHAAASQTLIACALDENNTIHKLRVKDLVFTKMKADDISFTVKTDNLICLFGENYLKKHKREQLTVVCSNKMREMARLLMEFRKVTNNSKCQLQDLLKPQLFDTVIECAKNIGGYDKNTRSFRSPSLSAHIGTSLKQICELYIRLLLKEDDSVPATNKEDTIKNTKRFKELIESQWTTEISSLAFKDLNEKKWQKPSMLPLTSDIMKFREHLIGVAERAVVHLKIFPDNRKEFKNLVEVSLILTILFNRKRIGDVQYTRLETYMNSVTSATIQEECEKALSDSERVLTRYYKRIVTGGKGSRPVAILFPTNLQNYIDIFLEIRSKMSMVPENNTYLFGCPGTSKWTRGDVVIRKYAQNANLQYPEQISSNKLRKQIATVMQILNLNKEETEHFAQFMGHTEKTHNEFYKLPQDLYQTAKISKLLLLMEKGADKYKGKSLNEIDVNPETEFAEEENSDKEDDNVNHSRGNVIEYLQDKPNEKPTVSKTKGRGPWNNEQAGIVKAHFKEHIRLKKAPRKDECVQLINKYPDILYNKDWVRVKTFVYNIYRDKK